MKKVTKPIQSDLELKVAAYLRVSTEEQADSHLGLDAQLAKVQGMCQVHGWNSPTLYSDDGVSGKIALADRPEGNRLLEDIKDGLVDVLIVSSLDRIGRTAKIVINFASDYQDSLQLVSCKEAIDTTTATGKLMLNLLASLAQFEVDNTSERTIDALNARGKSVGIKAGIPPYGYHYNTEIVSNGTYIKRVFHGVEIVPQEAEVVRTIYALRKDGLTLRAIAQQVPLSFNAVKNVLDRKSVYSGGVRGDSQQTWPIILTK